MSQDHIQRQIDVIIENQARFSEDILKLEENVARLAEQSGEIRGDIARLADVVMSLANITGSHGQQLGALIEQSKETDRRLMETDERLSALINVVERFISGQNGK